MLPTACDPEKLNSKKKLKSDDLIIKKLESKIIEIKINPSEKYFKKFNSLIVYAIKEFLSFKLFTLICMILL